MGTEKLRSPFAWALLIVAACACVMFFVSFQLGFFLLVFAAVTWWVWQAPEEGLLLFIVIAPLLPLFKATQTIGTVTLLKDATALALFTRVFFWPLLTKQLPYRRSLFFSPIVALAAWTAFETLRADSLTLGILRAREIILYILLYFAVLYLPHTRETWKRRLTWFTASFVIAGLHAAYQWVFAADGAVLRYDPGRSIWIPRISSTFGHPSVYGQYLIAAATLFLYGGLFFQKKMRWLFVLLFLMALPLIFLTYSRAVWIGFVAAVAVMGVTWFLQTPLSRKASTTLPFVRGGKLALGIFGFLATLFFIFRFTPAGSLLRSAFDPTYKSNEERLEFAARLVAPMSNVDAIIGRGLGDVTQQQLRKVDISAEEITSGAAREVQLAKDRTLVDNQYLKSFVELGLVGLIIYAWLFWRFFKGCLELFRSPNDQNPMTKTIIGLWGLGFLAAFVVQALFIDIWDIFPTNAMFWIVGGLVSAASTPEVKIRA